MQTKRHKYLVVLLDKNTYVSMTSAESFQSRDPSAKSSEIALFVFNLN